MKSASRALVLWLPVILTGLMVGGLLHGGSLRREPSARAKRPGRLERSDLHGAGCWKLLEHRELLCPEPSSHPR
ncbi:uncharacterized protein STAUR_1197 [Stigmatella aurantiaca DW4/3-1]|uniref:Uncharacterized protein n=1 Tax=Stigmatella aurantiaca (strain DW4/3-1) TaxID=378806 RepID=E3FG66_STIAD|nr:uncharacterized protein STAUR_1197 [Stigmatella aurantiaca DW4/3-1]